MLLESLTSLCFLKTEYVGFSVGAYRGLSPFLSLRIRCVWALTWLCSEFCGKITGQWHFPAYLVVLDFALFS
jgi:hypothetical protein